MASMSCVVFVYTWLDNPSVLLHMHTNNSIDSWTHAVKTEMQIRLCVYLAWGILRQKYRRLQDGGHSQTWGHQQQTFFISQELNVQLSSEVQKKVTMMRPRQCSNFFKALLWSLQWSYDLIRSLITKISF